MKLLFSLFPIICHCGLTVHVEPHRRQLIHPAEDYTEAICLKGSIWFSIVAYLPREHTYQVQPLEMVQGNMLAVCPETQGYHLVQDLKSMALEE